MELLNGKKISKLIKKDIRNKISDLKSSGKRVPGLAVVIVGNDKASQTYVASKEKACKKAGIYSKMITFPETVCEEELLMAIDKLNYNEKIDGILIQLPLPKHINSDKIINSILPQKDVDGFHYFNIGGLCVGNPNLISCTPLGIITLIKSYKIDLQGKNICIIGRSNIVGKPLAYLFLNENATVTVCHSKTKNISFHTRNADIIVCAVGKINFLKSDMVKDNAIVIDVGINVSDDGDLCGDVDFENVSPKCKYITPVPGGVGPMTIATLLSNTLKAYEKTQNK